MKPLPQKPCQSRKQAVWMSGLIAILILLLTSCSFFFPGKQVDTSSPAQCIPNFPDSEGWYGADGAYSIQLDAKRTLWLFGDTFVSSQMGLKNRVGMDLIFGNTIGISSCSAHNGFTIRYIFKTRDSAFVSFFGENEMLWPQDPFIVQNILYIPLLIVKSDPDQPAPFNFKITGHQIARICDTSSENPLKWQVQYLDWSSALPPGIVALAPTSVVHGEYIYFYSLYRHNQNGLTLSGNILARIDKNRLDTPNVALEYLHHDGTWSARLSPENVKILFDEAVSELSVRYAEQSKAWLAVYLSPGDKGRRLLYRKAPELSGPWSDPTPLIESIDEVDPSSPFYNPNTFCYAGKEHPQFAQNRQMIVTYVCNSSEPDHPASFLRQNLFLYRPVVKRIVYP